MEYMIRGKKLVTVSKLDTIKDGAMVIKGGKIAAVGQWSELKESFSGIKVLDYSKYIITPSLIDCHTHLLEFAPTSLYPVTAETHFLAGKAILFQALSSGITALGEQICGHPQCDFSIDDYRKAVKDFPMDISFAATSISIGFEQLAHFTSVTQSKSVSQLELTDLKVVQEIAEESDYPGENIFINATPANFTEEQVPRAGQIIYSFEELKQIADTYHKLGKKIGAHVAGEKGIEMALDAGIDVLHHAQGINDELAEKAAKLGVHIIATPIGGTHLLPNSPEEILSLMENNIPVSISTDAYLPPHPDASWLPFNDRSLKGPDTLMAIARPAMKLLHDYGYDENVLLAMITANPAKLLRKDKKFGRLEAGLDADFLVAEGVPGLEITENSDIKKVYFKGKEVINRVRK
ncbi:amidohydrolase family protein [Pseudalkalibacillus sp. A8]|uniref:amidohydrolase family protein n=1 Tax=Pseudalkalibacillus sp. A8 TaxID=3382641 RepID=UPI0038B44D00